MLKTPEYVPPPPCGVDVAAHDAAPTSAGRRARVRQRADLRRPYPRDLGRQEVSEPHLAGFVERLSGSTRFVITAHLPSSGAGR